MKTDIFIIKYLILCTGLILVFLIIYNEGFRRK